MRVDNVVDLRPDEATILEHLTALFGRATSGKIELAWTPSNTRAITNSEYFDVGDIDLAAERAVEINSTFGQNLYIGAALRKPDTAPMGRSDDGDFHEAWALHADCDTPDQIKSAKQAYQAAGMPPPIVCITGRVPHTRAHPWWPLEEPITDAEEYRAALSGLAVGLHSDPTVVNPSRVMRLAGTIAWPKKEGRVPERTELKCYHQNRRVFDPDEVSLAFPPVGRQVSTAVDRSIERKQSLILDQGKVEDGREVYMRNTILAVAIQMVGEAGLCDWPTQQELFDEAWPQYSAHVDFSRPGRGPDEFMLKCLSTLNRLARGHVRGCETPGKCHESYAKKNTEIPASQRDSHGHDTTNLKAEPLGMIDASKLQKREWIMESRFVAKFVTLTIAPGGLGKSTLTQQEAIAIAVGRDLTGLKVHTTGNVWLYNNEDPLDELHRRIAAICIHFKIPPADIADKVFLNSGRERRLIVAKELNDGVIYTPDVEALQQEIERNNIKLMVIDPFVRVHQVSENSNDAIDQVAEIFGKIADKTGCAFNLVHHTRKASNGTTYNGDADSARGAGSLMGAARVAHTLVGMTAQEAERFGIKDMEKSWYVRMDDAKSNMQAPAERAKWFKRQSVTLPNPSSPIADDGDKVGILEPWDPPTHQEATNISTAQATEILKVMHIAWAEGAPYSRSPNSKRYAGRLLQEHDIPKMAIPSILSIWSENGMIEEREYDHRNGLKGIAVLQYPGERN
jgi:hypothetical protein